MSSYPVQRAVRPASVPALLALAVWTPVVHAAEIRQDVDYTAVVIEAESFDSKSDRWVLTTPSTPAQSDDPDDNHSDGAVGKTYLELLPDLRVTHADQNLNEDFPSFWGGGLGAPRATYTVDFPEAGRYHVHVRALSTGTEDNGMHIGIDDTFPASGARVQSCAGKGSWTWTSRQRESGTAGACGIDYSLWLDVPSAGEHEVLAAPREDGYELDRFMLIKDQSGGTRRCRPSGADDIVCSDGALPGPDGIVNLNAAVEVAEGEVQVDSPVVLNLTARNTDDFDDATEVLLVVSPVDEGHWQPQAMDERCVFENAEIHCALGTLSPASVAHEEQLAITLLPLTSGLTQFTAMLTATEPDDDLNTAQDSVQIDVQPTGDQTTLSLTTQGPGSVEQGETSNFEVIVGNTGTSSLQDPLVSLDVPDQYTVVGTSSDCTASEAGVVQCSLSDFDAGMSRIVSVQLEAVTTGSVFIAVEATAANAEAARLMALGRVTEAAETEPTAPETPPETQPKPRPSRSPKPGRKHHPKRPKHSPRHNPGQSRKQARPCRHPTRKPIPNRR